MTHVLYIKEDIYYDKSTNLYDYQPNHPQAVLKLLVKTTIAKRKEADVPIVYCNLYPYYATNDKYDKSTGTPFLRTVKKLDKTAFTKKLMTNS